MKIALAVFGVVCASVFLGGWYFASEILEARPGAFDPAEERALLLAAGVEVDRVLEHVEIALEEATLAGTLLVHPESDRCAVVLLSGVGGNRVQVVPVVPIFWELGCHVLTYDHRGTGESSAGLRTYGFYERSDNAAVIDWLAQRMALPTSRIGLWGVSFGAAVALQTLEITQEIGFVVADSSYASLDQILQEAAVGSYGQTALALVPVARWIAEARAGMRFDVVAPEHSVASNAVPVLLIHAEHDSVVNIGHAKRIHDAGRPQTRLVIVRASEHGRSVVADYESYRDTVRLFIRESTGFGLRTLER